MSSWSLTTVRLDDGRTSAAIKRSSDGSFIVPAPLRNFAGLLEALEDWDTVSRALREIDVETYDRVEAQEQLSLQFPRKLLCVGANYTDHLAEMSSEPIPQGVEPFFFSLPPTTALLAEGGTILADADPTIGLDWEAELAVVIGRRARDVSEADALSFVGGYACFNDVTARGLMRRVNAIALPFTWDWLGSKGRDTFSPLGSVTPAWQIPDPGTLGVRCLVNGELKQDGNSRDLIVGIARLVATASRSWTLEPGDVIATGTPAGVGHGKGEHLAHGDVVVVDIDGLAPLTNRVELREKAALAG